ncbi:MAG: hypothetical protein ACD_21C00293G0007 [uncultured bacterium]|nr:MAG: hypothetical protein ACD_21C00293G0007 [uncultured bacterium]
MIGVLKILMKRTKTSLLLIGMALLMGCAHFQPQPKFKYISWQERQAKLQQNKNWVARGVLSVTYNKKRDIAHFEWQQNQDDYVINISGPMNLNKVKIVGAANKAEFCQSNGKCVQAKSSEQLFFKQFGWRLPVSNIRYWVLALPAPGKAENFGFDQYGHLVSFEQQGWRVKYSEFQSVKNIDLPNIIELKDKNFLIKLKIRDYFLGVK